MKAIVGVAIVVVLSAGAAAQSATISGGGPMGAVACAASGGSAGGGSSGSMGNGISQIRGTGIFPGRPTAIGALSANLRGDAQSCAALRRLSPSYHGLSGGGNTYFTRIFVDRDERRYFGYEVTLEQRSTGEYLMTFGQPGMTPMEAAIEGTSTGALAIHDWALRSTELPEPKIVHESDKINVELTLGPAAGLKVVDEITIEAYTAGLPRPGGLPTPRVPVVPSVEGTARDFTAADAEMTLAAPRVTINGTLQQAQRTIPPPGIPNAVVAGQPPIASVAQRSTGALLWLYLPGRGRYILSLVPRPELDFKVAGEFRGGKAEFTVGTDLISLECNNEIAPGHAPYRLYILLDPLWVPTAQSQKGQLAIGSVAVEELVKLKGR
jgi:hypothetical protein